MQNIFALPIAVPANNSYIQSYPHIPSYFAAKTTFDAADLVRGSHMVYGWMPTALDLYTAPPNLDAAAAGDLLTKAIGPAPLVATELQALAAVTNRSLVGASKLLHFVAPDKYAIWDSKVFRFVHGKRSHNSPSIKCKHDIEPINPTAIHHSQFLRYTCIQQLLQCSPPKVHWDRKGAIG